MRFFPLIAFLLMTARIASGLEVAGHQPAMHDRFSSGFPKAPVPNTSRAFIGAGFDWTGVGWDPDDPLHNVTLISPRHFLFATHQGIGNPGKELHWVGRDGTLRRYAIAKLQAVPFPPDALGNTKPSDLSLGTLAREIPAADGVKFYRVLFLGPDFTKYLRRRLFIYGHPARVGMNEVVDGYLVPGESAELKFLTSVLVSGMARTESGDSGSPTFLPWKGELALVGTHSRIGVDTFVPAFIGQLNKLMSDDGHLVNVLDASRD